MKRNALFLVLALSLVLVGAGCAETEPAPAPEPADAPTLGMPAPGSDVPEMVVEDGEGADEAEETAEPDVTFEISGTNFAFDKTELTVKEGDVVKIVFTSDEGFHDWVVDEFDAATEQIQAGNTSEVTFVADKAGEYEYYCSVGKHREMGMVGTLIVE